MRKNIFLLSAFLLQTIIGAISAQDTTPLFSPYWKSGELDPARSMKWAKPDENINLTINQQLLIK
jgi:hypothetical protein